MMKMWGLLLAAVMTIAAGVSLAVPAMSYGAKPHMSYGMSFNAPHATLAMLYDGKTGSKSGMSFN